MTVKPITKTLIVSLVLGMVVITNNSYQSYRSDQHKKDAAIANVRSQMIAPELFKPETVRILSVGELEDNLSVFGYYHPNSLLTIPVKYTCKIVRLEKMIYCKKVL